MGLWANSGHDTGRHKSSWGFKCQSVQMPCFPKSAVAWVLTVNQTHTVDFILILHFFFNFTKRWREECWVHSESDSEVTQSCPTLCDPVDCNLPGSSVHGILQARILEWVAISFSRGSSWPRDWTRVSHLAGKRFNLWATREAQAKS